MRKSWEDEEEALSRQRIDIGPHNQADCGFVEMSTFGMCRSACSNLFEEKPSFGMNDQLLLDVRLLSMRLRKLLISDFFGDEIEIDGSGTWAFGLG